MMTERADAFSGPGCGQTRLDALNCLDVLSQFVDPSAFAHESCIKVAIRVRGVVPTSTFVVDNNRQCTMYNSNTVAFSHSVLIKCCILSLSSDTDAHQENDSRHMTHTVILFHHGSVVIGCARRAGRSLLDSLFVVVDRWPVSSEL